jgi:hypothetical protein
MDGEPYREPCRQLNHGLNLKLREPLHAALHGEMLVALYLKSDPSLFRQLFATLSGWLYESKYAQLLASSCLALLRQKLPSKQPVGRGVGGRIVARSVPTTTSR